MMGSQGKDRGDAHIPAKFLAGRGRALKELASKPLRAEEVEKMRRLQELILRGSVPLDKPGKVPGGLSQGKWPKSPSQTGRQYNRRPDPIWTSYRSDECSINSYGSNSSVGTSSISSSTGVPTPPKSETPPQSDSDASSRCNKSQSDAAGTWNKPQINGTSAWDKPQIDGTGGQNKPQSDASGTWNKPQINGTSAWDKLQIDGTSGRNKPQSDAPGTWNKSHIDGSSAWDKPQIDNTSAWNKPQSDGTGRWNKPQIDDASAWDEPQRDASSSWNKLPSPFNNRIGHSNRRAFRQEIPPRFRNRILKQRQHEVPRAPEVHKVNHYDFGANQKHKTANDNDWGKSSQGLASMQNEDNIQQSAKKAEEHPSGPQDMNTDLWSDWEKSVVIHGTLSEQDIEEIAVIEDNDDIHDVFVSQYLNALHEEEMSKKPKEELQLTPSKTQQISKLKSTIQADIYKPPLGTIPKPRKIDRWGGTELQNSNGPVGWGDLDSGGNWYEDGVSAWSTAQNTSGWS